MIAFEEVKGHFGFGCMRLPEKDGTIDYEEFTRMIDKFIEEGFNYFDTARPYHHGESEKAIKKCLTSRYPRDKYLLADKLSSNYFNEEKDIRPLIMDQLDTCGVEYFDFYLMHALDAGRYEKYKKTRAFEIGKELKKEGKIRHLGFSFHDSAKVLDQILREQEGIDFVQLQFNYIDYENENVQSRLCYETCVKHHVPVTVMEPIKGGKLINLPIKAKELLESFNDGSIASFALRYVWSFENIHMVLSGMSNYKQMLDNLNNTKLNPLTDKELEAINEVVNIINSSDNIPCTACEYCVDGCPMGIKIPNLFKAYNQYQMFGPLGSFERKEYLETSEDPRNCIECGQCEGICPQHLEVISLLKKVSETIYK